MGIEFPLENSACVFSKEENDAFIMWSVFWSTFLYFTIVLIAFLFVSTCFKKPFLLLVAILFDYLINYLIKMTLRMPRPPDSCLKSYGMPSGHSQTAFLLATISVLYYYNRFNHNDRVYFVRSFCWFSFWCVGSAVSIVISRVILRHHTITQVCVGSLLGVFDGVICWFILSSCLSPRRGHKCKTRTMDL